MKEKDFIEFAKIIGKLKRIPRTGWKTSGVKEPESVAEHIFRAVVIGMLLGDSEKLNTEKMMRMLLLSDLEEAVTGDIELTKKYKKIKEIRKGEEKAIKKIFYFLPKKLRNKYVSLWKELKSERTKEAKLCKDIDKLEMMIQAFEYELEDKKNRKRLKKFWEWELNKPKRYPLTKKIYRFLEDVRNENY